MAQVVMFDQAPTVDSVHSVVNGISRALGYSTVTKGLVQVVLDELAFVMKTVTRLGRAINLAEAETFFAHAHQPVASQLGAWYERLAQADERDEDEVLDDALRDEGVDWTKVVDVEQLGPLVAARAGVPSELASDVVNIFFSELTELLEEGVDVGTPTRWLDLELNIERELLAHLDVLAWHGYDLALHGSQVYLGAAGIADVICRTTDGGWLVIELKRVGAHDGAVEQISRYVGAVERDLARAGEKVSGLVMADGDSDLFLTAVAGDPRIRFLNLRSLDLPVCRAQRWVIETQGVPTGWAAVAADGRTVVGGGGPGLPPSARMLPFGQLELDWATTKVWPMPVGERSRPGQD